MTELSKPWQSTSPGDAGPYSAANWQQLYQSIIGLGASRANVGPLLGTGTQPNDGLKVQAKSVPTTSIDVLAGAALIQGIAYINSATVSFVIAANGSGNPRIDTVILQADYALQTVRLTVLQGTPAASPSPVALTQTANVLWEIPIADIAVANGFTTITNANITPRHEWANAANGVYLDSIINNSGGTLVSGDVVILDSTADRAAKTTTTASDKLTLGIWVGRTANGSYGRVLKDGIGYVNCAAAVTRGQVLSTHTVAKQAAVNAAGYYGFQLATALETTSGAGLCLCYILPTSRGDGDYVLVQDQKATNTAPASITSGGWRTRELNTEVVDTGNLATVASNQVTLQPGRYKVYASTPASVAASRNRIRIQNITAGTTIVQGVNVLTVANASPLCTASGEFILTIASIIEIQHYTSATGTGGLAVNSGENEVYANLEFLRLGDS